MKRVIIVLSIAVCIGITSCESHRATRITSDTKADSPGSGAKMLDSGGVIRTDSVIIDTTNYGPPKS